MLFYTYTENYIYNKLLFIFLFIFLFVYFINLLVLFILFSNKYNNSNNFLKLIKITTLSKKNFYYLLLVFSSLIGIPPLSGFVSKLILVFLFTFKFNLFNLILVYLFIIFNVFFYLQFLKLINKKELMYFDILKNKKNTQNKFKNHKFTSQFLLVVCGLFTLSLVFFIKDLFLMFHFFLF